MVDFRINCSFVLATIFLPDADDTDFKDGHFLFTMKNEVKNTSVKNFQFEHVADYSLLALISNALESVAFFKVLW